MYTCQYKNMRDRQADRSIAAKSEFPYFHLNAVISARILGDNYSIFQYRAVKLDRYHGPRITAIEARFCMRYLIATGDRFVG